MYLIIGRKNCPYCDKAKQLMEDVDYKYIYVDITSGDCISDSHWKHFLVEDVKAKTVPQIFELIGGYEEFKELTIG